LALGPRLKAYLALERAMVDLDDAEDPLGDEFRDRMDPIWLKLSEQERAALDNRAGQPSEFAGIVDWWTVPGTIDSSVVTDGRRDLVVRDNARSHFRRAA